MAQEVFSVTQINQYIKTVLDGDAFLQRVYIRGELSNYKRYSSGHHYFSMKDEEGAIRCVMFRGSATRLRFQPESGMKVIAFGRISAYPRDGAYQFYVEAMSPDGIGDLAVAFEQLKNRLAAEGLFATEHKKPLPRFPKTVAIVTSGSGAAVHDMIRIMRTRWPLTKIKLLPVRVQGVEAPPEIVGAIRYANRWKVGDVIIVGRGGGSMEDLWCFNDERVARAIYASELPVISAVGHEPDVTISDFVADVRASTPSNAAELVVPDQNEILGILAGVENRQCSLIMNRLQNLGERLGRCANSRVLQSPYVLLEDKQQRFDHARHRLATAMERVIERQERRLAVNAAKLDAYSPLKVLARGYSATFDEYNRPITSAAALTVGDSITTQLAEGSVTSTVTAVTPPEKGVS